MFSLVEVHFEKSLKKVLRCADGVVGAHVASRMTLPADKEVSA